MAKMVLIFCTFFSSPWLAAAGDLGSGKEKFDMSVLVF
jgi:hypothetical protein